MELTSPNMRCSEPAFARHAACSRFARGSRRAALRRSLSFVSLGLFPIRIVTLSVLLVAASYASEPQPWPEAADLKLEFAVTPPDTLPRGLDFDQVTVEGHEPHNVGICWLDLNRDGTPELLVDSHEGGTGGSYKLIFARTSSGFRRIASFMGGLTFVAPVNGYYQLESWSSAGGGEFSRALYRYERGRYRMVRLEDWRGFGEEEGWRFIRSRNPKEYDE